MSISNDYIQKATLKSELAAFKSPPQPEVAPQVKIGDQAPQIEKLPQLQNLDGHPVVLAFLRHCGCPFSEKSFQQFRHQADLHPDVRFIAISHSSQKDTDEWIISVGGTGDVEIIVDEEREIYAKWGLGLGSYWSNIGFGVFWKSVKLGQDEKIYNRPTNSGYRMQTAGGFSIDVNGIVRWIHYSQDASDIANWEDGLRAIGYPPEKKNAKKQEVI